MRKLIYGINLTIDGCCDHTKANPYEDIHDFFTELFRQADTTVYGRITYQLMVPFWPDVARNNPTPNRAMNDFAQAFDAVKKIVFSHTQESVEDKNSELIKGNLADEILKLKQQEGKDILLGGVDLPGQLIALGLVDEYYFVIQPILAGEGRKLFDGAALPEKLELKLVETKVLGSGCVVMHYVK